MNLIPLPHQIVVQTGTFMIMHDTSIILDANQNNYDFDTAKLLQREINKVLALQLLIKKKLNHGGAVKANSISFEFDSEDRSPEAYRLIVTPDNITIYASSSRGFLYGASTLIQLCRFSHGNIECVEITDSPSFKNRGYMLDVSRGRVPTMESLKELVDTLSLYKINQLQLYMENCLRLDGFEEIWSQTDPFLPEEILELDLYCESRGIELVPCVATFGHLYDLLHSISFGKYRELDAKGEIFTWRNRLRYYTINISDPGSVALITGILEQYIPLFKSKKFNICCDETFDLGKGKSAALAKKMTYGEMYASYVNQLVDYLHSKDREVMIWGDILQNNPDAIEKINPKVTCLNWYYGYGAKEHFAQLCHDNNLNLYVCPSVSGYSRLVNDYDLSFTNISEMAEIGMKYEADGFLNTDWGDSGHINMPALNIPCLIYGAAKSWNNGDNRDFDTIDKTISLLEFDDHNKALAGSLRSLSHQDLVTINDLVIFRDYKEYKQIYTQDGVIMHKSIKEKIMGTSEDHLKSAVSNCMKILESLQQNESAQHLETRQQMNEYYLAARGVSLMQEVALILKKKEYSQNVAPLHTPFEVASRLEDWLMDYCRDWRAVSRESELYRIKEFIWQLCAILRKDYGKN